MPVLTLIGEGKDAEARSESLPRVTLITLSIGVNRQTAFFADEDRSSYLATLREFREKLGVQVYAYCLMTNHVHLIVHPGNDAANLSLLMKRLAGRHTRRLNRLKRRSGTAWDGRFKCSPIESSPYLLACARYIDLNPVRAHIVPRPENYEWSSYRARVGLSNVLGSIPTPAFLRSHLPPSSGKRDIASMSPVGSPSITSHSCAPPCSAIS